MNLKLFLIFLIAGLNADFDINVSEMNLLYQFGDLVTDQFAYMPEETFDYLKRLDNNISAMNHITTDLVCFLEWNGNLRSQHYLDIPGNLEKIFVKEFNAWQIQNVLLVESEVKAAAEKNAEKKITKANEQIDRAKEQLGNKSEINDKINELYQKNKETYENDAIKEIKDVCRSTLVDLIDKNEKDLSKMKTASLSESACKKLLKNVKDDAFNSRLNNIPDLCKDFECAKNKIGTMLSGKNQDSYNDDESEFHIRLGIMKKVVDLELLKSKAESKDSREFIRTFVFKKSGVPLTNGTRIGKYTTPNKPPAKASIPTQTIFFAYDNTKYIDFFENTPNFVFVPAKIEESSVKPEAQNFLVKFLLKHKDEKEKNCSKDALQNCEKVVVICTHFKAKAAGYESRMVLGSEINNFVTRLRKGEFKPQDSKDLFYDFKDSVDEASLKNFQSSVILLIGDLNSEVNEVAQHLKSMIVGLETQFNINEPKINTLGKEKNFQINSLHFKEVKPEERITKLPQKEDGRLSFSASEKSIAVKVKDAFDANTTIFVPKNPAILLNDQSRNLVWIEANNFPTERKIRLKELNYDGVGYNNVLKYIKQLKEAADTLDPFNKDKCFDFLKDEMFMYPIPKRTMEDTDEDLMGLMTARFNRVGQFLESLKCFRTYLKDDTISKGAQLLITSLYQTVYSSLMEVEKIDFILINSEQEVQVTKVDSVEFYEDLFKFGIPNLGYGSDHFPTKVTIKVVGEATTGYSNSLINQFIEKANAADPAQNIYKQVLNPQLTPDWVELREHQILLVEVPEKFVDLRPPKDITSKAQPPKKNLEESKEHRLRKQILIL